MVVELDRDPALYSDNNIVEVSVLLSLPSIPQLTVFDAELVAKSTWSS